jgi:hypothetical protein
MPAFISKWLPGNKKLQALGFLLILFTSLVSAQIPARLISELDAYNEQIYKGLLILKDQPEEKAISELADIKKDLYAKAESLQGEMEKFPELTEEQDQAFMEQQMGKKLYQDMMNLLSDPQFNQKIAASSRLTHEFEELMLLLDLEGGSSSESEDEALPESVVCSFTVSPDIPNSGQYQVSSEENNAMGFSDDDGGLTIEIFGNARGNEVLISIIADEASPGKYVWSAEGQIYIQSADEEGNEVIQLQNYHEEGFITLESIGPVGGRIKGSFQGLFFDDMEQTDEPVFVQGQFDVLHFESPY